MKKKFARVSGWPATEGSPAPLEEGGGAAAVDQSLRGGSTPGAWKPAALWLPSQRGFFALWPQRQTRTAVLPERSKD